MNLKQSSKLPSEFFKNMDNLLISVKKQIMKGLPGKKIQNLMAPEGRMSILPNNSPIDAAVLILLYKELSELSTILIKRPNYAGHHGGQISFPGGKHEPADRNLISTAIREAGEETGIDTNSIHYLAKLTPLYIPVSNINVLPVIAYCNSTPIFSPCSKEVDYLITVPLRRLIFNKTGKENVTLSDGSTLCVPVYQLNGETIWGATAMIMSEFIEIMKKTNIITP